MNTFKNLIGGVSLCIMILSGCSSDQKSVREVPQNVIPKEKMIEIMVEMQILEAKIVEAKLGKDKSVTEFNDAQKKLLASFGVDSLQYYESDKFYMADIDTYSEMVTALTDTIDQRRNQLSEGGN